MNNRMVLLICCLALPMLATGQEIEIKPITPEITAEDLVPRITIDEAIAVAREFVKTNAIDVSEHYLSAARFVVSPTPREATRSRREWIVTWENPEVFRDDIIVFVDMKKNVFKWWRKGRQQPLPQVQK